MYSKLIHFVKYNNAFNIIFVIFFFGFGISFAASEDVRESLYSSQETIVSVDNTFIVSTDLDTYNFNLRINGITEDEKNYYASYAYQTIVVENSVWQNKEIEKTLTINKDALQGKDLGLYVAKELGENINYELSYLKRTQQLEKEKGESQKMITVEYSGLIGKLLDPKEMVIEGYTPVIPEPIPEVTPTVEDNPEMIIVSVQHPEPEIVPMEEPPLPAPEIIVPPEEVIAPPTGEETQTPVPEEEETAVEESPIETPSSPVNLINEELVQEIVEAFLEENPVSNSAPAPEPTPVVVQPEVPPALEPVLEPEAPAPITE